MTTTPARDYLARFLVIRTCGYLEQVVLAVYRYYVTEKSGGLVRTFAHSWLQRANNPSPEALTELIGRFDAGLSAEFDDLLNQNDELWRREIHFLVDRRNRIAHGLNEGVTVRKALDLNTMVYEIADWFVVKFNPYR